MENQSTILQLFYGNIGTYDTIKLGENYKKLLEKVVIQDESFRKALKKYPHFIKEYNKTNDLIDQMNGEINETYYLEGFKIGLLVGIEAKNL